MLIGLILLATSTKPEQTTKDSEKDKNPAEIKKICPPHRFKIRETKKTFYEKRLSDLVPNTRPYPRPLFCDHCHFSSYDDITIYKCIRCSKTTCLGCKHIAVNSNPGQPEQPW